MKRTLVKMRFYIASPFFNETELKHVIDLEKLLDKQGYDYFSPRLSQLPHLEFGGFEWRVNVFRNDINHIKWADAIIAIIRGNYDDAGTVFEVGYGYAMGKPIYIYNPDDGELNLMVTESLQAHMSSLEDLDEYDFEKAPIKPYTGSVM